MEKDLEELEVEESYEIFEFDSEEEANEFFDTLLELEEIEFEVIEITEIVFEDDILIQFENTDEQTEKILEEDIVEIFEEEDEEFIEEDTREDRSNEV